MGAIDLQFHSHSSFKDLSWDDIFPGVFRFSCGNLSVKIDVIWLDALLPWFRSAFSCPSDPKVNEVQRT